MKASTCVLYEYFTRFLSAKTVEVAASNIIFSKFMHATGKSIVGEFFYK